MSDAPWRATYAAFADTYHLEYGQLTEDIAFYTELARNSGGPVLEMAIGNGRVALPIAREGIRVVGIDSSPEMLVRLETAASREPDLPVSWHVADMAEFDVTAEGPFRMVYCPARAFLHLETTEEHLSALACVRRHLDDGGIFAGNVFFPDIGIINRGWRGDVWRHGHEYVDPASGLEVMVSHRTYHDPREQHILAQFRHEYLSASGEIVKTEIREHRLCWIWPRELEHLLARAGFDLEAMYGDWDRTPFPEKAVEILWVARKRPT